MNTKYLLGAAIVAVLNCATLNAQVLGGNAVGGLGGSLGGNLGGMRDIGVMGQGNGHGAFGADLDTGSLRRTTGDLTHRATDRTRDTLETTRGRTHSSVNGARDATKHAVGTAAATARNGAQTGASTAFSAAHNAEATSKQVDATAKGAASAASSVELDDSIEPRTPSPSASIGGALDKSVATDENADSLPLAASSSAAAQGGGSASRDNGVYAQGATDGSASASLKK
jgi:hypothetical protein